MNIAFEILLWQIPFSCFIAMWSTSGMVGGFSPLVIFVAFLGAWLLVALVVFTFDMLVVLLGFTVTGIAKRLVS